MKKSFEEVRMRITFVSKDSVLCIGELPQLEPFRKIYPYCSLYIANVISIIII